MVGGTRKPMIKYTNDGVSKGRFKKKKKKLMEFSIKGPDPARQHLNGKRNKIKHCLKML